MKKVYTDLKFDLFLYSIITLVLSIVMVSEAYILQYIIDSFTFRTLEDYIYVIIPLALFLISQTIIYYKQQYMAAALSKKSSYLLRRELFENISNSSVNLLSGIKRDKILSILSTQVDQVENYYFYTIFWGSYLICQLFVAIVISLTINPALSLITILLSLPNLLIALFFKKNIEKNQEELFEANNTYLYKTQDLTEGSVEWKINSNGKNIQKVFDFINNNLLVKSSKVIKYENYISSLNQLFSNVLYFGSWFVGGIYIIKGDLSIGGLVAFSQLIARISFPVYASSDLIPKYVSGKKILKTLFYEFPSNYEIGKYKETENKEIESISFKNYLLNDREGKLLLKFNYEFLKGKKYILVGESGSGKTTIIRSIIKDYVDYNGDIFINKENIKCIDEYYIHKKIAYIPQEPHIFDGTIADNITMFSSEYDINEVIKILNFVELGKWANEKSLLTDISKNKLKISGGEAKRISLARALFQNKNILLLDEFSSGIDKLTLRKIEEKLFNSDKTIIYVTHLETNISKNSHYNVVDLSFYK